MVTRRRILRTGLTTVATVAGTAAALVPVLVARGRGGTVEVDGVPGGVREPAAPLFDEVYRGRRVQGFRADSEPGVDLFVDGRRLHVMRRADGTWISMANHFQPFLTPLATARGAVDVIGRARLAAASGDSARHLH